MQRSRIWMLSLSALSLLMVPLIAMGVTEEVRWNLSDFVVAGVILLSLVLGTGWILQKIPRLRYRLLLVGLLLMAGLLLWVEMAVDLLGSPLAGN